MSRISKWERLVHCILAVNKEARGNDRYLYLQVLRSEGFDPANLSLENYLINGHEFQYKGGKIQRIPLPNYDTITRVRRKLQERHPELRAPQRTQAIRSDAEGEFREYARTT